MVILSFVILASLSGSYFNVKMLTYLYKNLYYKSKIITLSFLCNGIFCTVKMAYLCWNNPHVLTSHVITSYKAWITFTFLPNTLVTILFSTLTFVQGLANSNINSLGHGWVHILRASLYPPRRTVCVCVCTIYLTSALLWATFQPGISSNSRGTPTCYLLVVAGYTVSYTTHHTVIGNVTLVVIIRTIILVSYLCVKSLQLIWRSEIHRLHLWVPDLEMSCRNLTMWWGTTIVAPAMSTGPHAPLIK